MKTIKLTSSALAALTLVTLAAPTFADSKSYTSNGTIEYTPSTSITTPVDPQDPETAVTPENPDGTTPPVGTAGPLSIDFASSFDFGKQEITSVDKVYNAAAQKLNDGTTRTNYVQVTDNRGTLAGWSLNVMATDFTNGKTGAGSTLTGAQITLGDGEIQSASQQPADKFMKSTTLTPNTASGTILGASAGNGAGTNLLDFGGKDGKTKDTAVTLSVPGNSTKLAGKYTAQLTWTLSETPAN